MDGVRGAESDGVGRRVVRRMGMGRRQRVSKLIGLQGGFCSWVLRAL